MIRGAMPQQILPILEGHRSVVRLPKSMLQILHAHFCKFGANSGLLAGGGYHAGDRLSPYA